MKAALGKFAAGIGWWLAWASLLAAQDLAGPSVAPPPGPPGQPHVFAPAETIAIVGDQHILAGDLLGEINQMLAPYVGKAPEDELEEQRQILLRQMLPGVVENKILYQEFLRKVPPERLKDVEAKLNEEFDEDKLGPALTRAKVNSPAELDALLRKYGSSLEKQRRAYREQKLGRAMFGRDVNYKPEITHDEMLAYYREHAAEFDVAAKARWEQLTVRLSNHKTKEEALDKLADMGNQVLRGAPFSAVAKKFSDASNAAAGGQNDWITQGSLASEVLDRAVFTLPLNRLSQIIDDGRGAVHIIRVLERQDAHRIEFVDAQPEIKEKLVKQKIQEQISAYVNKLKAKTKVWTVFDDETAAAQTATKPSDKDRFQPVQR